MVHEVMEILLGSASEFSPPLTEYGDIPETQGLDHREAGERFVRAVLLKWRRENTPGGVPELRRFEPDYHAGVRTVIATAAAKADLLWEELHTAEDLSVRRGFYSGSRRWTPEAIREAYKRDGVEFLREAVGSDVFHERRELADTMRALVDQFRDASDSNTSFDQRQDLKRWWHDRGMHLWRQDHFRYQHPDRELRPVDEDPFERLDLLDALDRTEREAMDTFRRVSATIHDVERDGGIDPLHLTRINFEATWNATGASFNAFRRIARDLAEARQRELDGKLLVAAVEKGIWRAVMTIAVVASIVAVGSRLF